MSAPGNPGSTDRDRPDVIPHPGQQGQTEPLPDLDKITDGQYSLKLPSELSVSIHVSHGDACVYAPLVTENAVSSTREWRAVDLNSGALLSITESRYFGRKALSVEDLQQLRERLGFSRLPEEQIEAINSRHLSMGKFKKRYPITKSLPVNQSASLGI